MASQSILRAGITSPARAFIKPCSSTRSILKRPAPLPLSPNPMQFTASFSVVINSSHLSPHVHFPSSASIAATLTTYSPNTYDRGPIPISPGSGGFSPWNNKALSPTAHNAFKLLDPPKRKKSLDVSNNTPTTLAPPMEGTRAHTLAAPPVFEDPRSPKPYKSRAGANFTSLTILVPRNVRGGAEELGRALSTYPRSPYPSAPVEDDMDSSPSSPVSNEDKDRGRSTNVTKPQYPARARSLPNSKAKRRQNQAQHQHQNLMAVSSPLKQNFLANPARGVHVVKPTPLDLEGESDSLSQEFWRSMSLEDSSSSPSVYQTAIEGPEVVVVADGNNGINGNSKSSNNNNITFGNKDGSLWSPRVSKSIGTIKTGRGVESSLLSPGGPRAAAATNMTVFNSKSMVASPTPNDPFASFPSFSIALMSMDGVITYPPRAQVEQD